MFPMEFWLPKWAYNFKLWVFVAYIPTHFFIHLENVFKPYHTLTSFLTWYPSVWTNISHNLKIRVATQTIKIIIFLLLLSKFMICQSTHSPTTHSTNTKIPMTRYWRWYIGRFFLYNYVSYGFQLDNSCYLSYLLSHIIIFQSSLVEIEWFSLLKQWHI
jgi:hypothetical protein